MATRVVATPAAEMGTALRAWMLDALARGRGPFVGLAVGSSTLPLYADLPSDPAAWTGTHLTPIDELVPSPADPAASFLARLRAALPPAVTACTEPLAAVAPHLARARFRALVLGLGPDGHIAFNQPGSRLDDGIREVEITPPNLARLSGISPAARALTIGVRTILRAERVLLVVAGEGKDEALQRVLEGPEGADVPASYLRRHGELTVVFEP